MNIRCIGRCKACGKRDRMLVTLDAKREWTGYASSRRIFAYTLPSGRVINGWERSFIVKCACGKPMVYSRVMGILRPDKPCNNACLNAHGSHCECACAGENHGKSHDSAMLAPTSSI